ncbi:MAG: cyclic lactone autoinducer peptide [Anaerocolumna aminovalerica]|nr:cyclic lactone autoinducer peptide [Anaerocolumna aminovalerica]MDU6266727.1 cyclic lactone autoinducer peptide [Anaerocolumna aminovalerica]
MFCSLTLFITALNVTATCIMYVHQPKLPDNSNNCDIF